MPSSVQVTRLRQALQAFSDNPPRDLPDGVAEKIAEVQSALSTHGPSNELSAGTREAAHAAGVTDATGTADYKHAARGVDKPSPGQQEAVKAASSPLSEEIERAAQAIHEKLTNERAGANSGGSGNPVPS